MKTVILPKRNEFDLDDVPEEIKNKIQFIFVETVDDVLAAALEKKQTGAKPEAVKQSEPGEIQKENG